MHFGGLLPYQIDEIKDEAEKHFVNWPDEYKSKLWMWLQTVFQLWKNECGDRFPETGGLLPTPIDFEKAEPYQCAGFGVSNNIDLAFKLWVNNYEPFNGVVEKVGIHKIFAVLLLHEAEMSNVGSITRARNLLHDLEKATIEATLESLAPHIHRGAKTLDSARKGHEAVYGSATEKEEKWAKYQDEVDRLATQNQRLSYADIMRKVAQKFEVSETTIKRHTRNPKTK